FQPLDQYFAGGVGRLQQGARAVQPRKVAAAGGAVVVGGDDEGLPGGDRLAVQGEPGDALAPGSADVDHVGQAVALDLVEVVAGHARVDQCLRLGIVRVDAVETLGRALQPRLERGAVDLHRREEIGRASCREGGRVSGEAVAL